MDAINLSYNSNLMSNPLITEAEIKCDGTSCKIVKECVKDACTETEKEIKIDGKIPKGTVRIKIDNGKVIETKSALYEDVYCVYNGTLEESSEEFCTINTPISCFEYSKSSSSVTIRNYKCYEGNAYGYGTILDVVIPEKIEDKPVTRIQYSAFQNKKLTSIKFPSELTSIGSYAFQNNNIRGEIDLSNTKITDIGVYAFSDNQIESVKFPDTLTIISMSFSGNQISNIKFPKGLTKIADYAFDNNKLTKTMDLSNLPLTYIGDYAFNNSDIKELKLPSTIEFLSGFSNNKNLSEVNFSDLINLKTIGNSAFNRTKITEAKLPTTITTLGDKALESVTLTTIVNKSGLEFDWNSIAGKGESGACTFINGICGNLNRKNI